ncbi:MAG: nucleotidyltransferase domain-containing protein [Actinomycetota bacterium]
MEHILEEALANRTRIRLLRRLHVNSMPRSGRELAHEIGCSHTHAINNLRALEDGGLIIRRRVGAANTYVFNEKSYIVRNVIIPLLEAEQNYLNALASRFVDGLGSDLVRIILFGSMAKGTATPQSDMDLVIVVRNGSDVESIELEAAGIVADAIVEFGRPIDTLVVTESELESKTEEGRGMWRELPDYGIDLLQEVA